MPPPGTLLRIGLAVVGVVAMLWVAGSLSLRADLRVPNAEPVAAGEATIEQPWTHFAADASATQYSRVAQITPDNVDRLELAWLYRTGEMQRRPSKQFQSSDFANTPILAGGSLIVCTPWNRLIALDPVSGAERWVFDPDVQADFKYNKFVCRGVASWRDSTAPSEAACVERLIMGTQDQRILAIDARTGKRCAQFGQNGELRVRFAEDAEAPPEVVKFNAPPIIVNDVAIFGSAILDGYLSDRPLGTVRAFDVRTGALKWTFDPVPRELADAAWPSRTDPRGKRFGGGNVWADMSADESRDLVFLPTSSASMDFFGGFRPGDNRYANSVVALRASTGEVVWSYQIVHHDLWDYDLPTAPMLLDLQVAGATVPALVQLTKQGLIFVLNRETGVPVFPVEERAFPPSDLVGEHASPTQPIPVTMPALMPHGLQATDAWGATPWDRGKCRQEIERYRGGGLYVPPSEQGTVFFPTFIGGPNLGMRAYDPERRLLIVSLNRTANVLAVARNSKPDETATGPYRHGFTKNLLSPFGAPCNAPPWGMLTAVDLEHQQIVWQQPLGSIEKLAPLPIPIRWGTPSRGGPMLTASGLTFIAGTMDDAIRAFDTRTGEELWKRRLPAGGQATPMSYVANGRQYVVIAAGGHARLGTTLGDYVLAFALHRRLVDNTSASGR